MTSLPINRDFPGRVTRYLTQRNLRLVDLETDRTSPSEKETMKAWSPLLEEDVQKRIMPLSGWSGNAVAGEYLL